VIRAFGWRILYHSTWKCCIVIQFRGGFRYASLLALLALLTLVIRVSWVADARSERGEQPRVTHEDRGKTMVDTVATT
jgi:hypothetical protein